MTEDIDRDFIVDELEKVCTDFKILRNDMMIVCPFHADSNPSCSVHLSGHKMPAGTYHCWSCGAKGPWNRLADKLGIDSGKYYSPINPFRTKLRAMQRREKEEEALKKQAYRGNLPAGSMPWEHGSFRELPEKFLVSIGAMRYYDDKSNCHRIVFPVKNRIGAVIGSTARRLDKVSQFPWINSDGAWAKKTLYPLELLPKNVETVVLVEGPYDSLRMNYYGIPTLAILGTQNWCPFKNTILTACGIKNVVICMDGDNAGRVAERNILEDTKGIFKRKRFRLPFENPPVDPGNMSMERVELLKDFCTNLD